MEFPLNNEKGWGFDTNGSYRKIIAFSLDFLKFDWLVKAINLFTFLCYVL